jgi:hypothetical protein
MLGSSKKKIYKPLDEILGPDFKSICELPNDRAIKFFDKREEKDRVKEVLSGAFKTPKNRDYNLRLYGYKRNQFLASVHNPYRIEAQSVAAFGDDDYTTV